MFNFKNYLLQELNSDKVVVLEEQMFAKNGEFEPEKIYVVIKYLSSSIEYGAETQPIQMLILSEENSLQEAKDLFDSFTISHNWLAKTFNNTFVKQQYSSPVVMSNFTEVAYGYRSVLYVSATLFIMDNVSDVTDLKIKGVNVKPIQMNWSYQMTGNTQPIGGEPIASTEKNISTFQTSLSIPTLNTYVSEEGFEEDEVEGDSVESQESSGTFTLTVDIKPNYYIVARGVGDGIINSINQKTGEISYTKGNDSYTIKYHYIGNNLLSLILKVSSGQISGNIVFNVSFKVFDVYFDFDCKLVSCQMITTPNDVPALQVGLQR